MSDNSQPIQTVSSTSNSSIESSQTSINSVLGGVAIALPILFVVGVRGYQNYRRRVLRERVETLERIWSLSPQKRMGY
jgi:hypothetical protein